MQEFETSASHDPLLMHLSAEALEISTYERQKNQHDCGLSEASTDLGFSEASTEHHGFSWPYQVRHHSSEPSSYAFGVHSDVLDEKTQSFNDFEQTQTSSPPRSPDDIGALLLQAFQIRDNYFELQERHVAEVSALQAELIAARHHISTLQSQLRSAEEETHNVKACLHATQNELGGLQHELETVPKQTASRLADGLLQIRRRCSLNNMQANCFAAWNAHLSKRRKIELISKSRADGHHHVNLCRCLYAWASHTQSQQLMHQQSWKPVVNASSYLAMCRCWRAWSKLTVASVHVGQPATNFQDADCARNACSIPPCHRISRAEEKIEGAGEVVILTTEGSVPGTRRLHTEQEKLTPEKSCKPRHVCAAPLGQLGKHVSEVRRQSVSVSAPYACSLSVAHSVAHKQQAAPHPVITTRRPPIIAAASA